MDSNKPENFNRVKVALFTRYRLKAAVVITLVTLLLGAVSGQLINLHTPPIAVADTVQQVFKTSVTHRVIATSSPAVPQPTGAPTPHSATPIPACVPFTATTLPSPIGLTTMADGLTKVVDNPQQYTIYGNNPAALRAQIQQCAPKSSGGTIEYAAETSYQITWQYSIVAAGGDQCRITHAKVGVHVLQTLPLWHATTDAQSGLDAQWARFMKSLTQHEDGHTDLDLQYAQILLDDLNSFPPTSCALLAQNVKYVTDSDITTLDQANDNYDSSTDHGATQGAILPQ